MKAAKKILSTLLSVLLALVIVLAAFFAFTTLATRDTAHVANFLGYTPMTVQSDSMVPFFKTGDLIIIQTCDVTKLQVGDVVTFHTIIENQYALNTHRITEIIDSGSVRSYVTKGDNNVIADTRVISDGDIVGKYVTKIGGFGRVIDFLSSSTGFLIVIVLPMLCFFIYQVYHLVMVSISLKKAIAMEENSAAQTTMDEAAAALAEANRIKAEYEAKLREAEEKAKQAQAEEK